MTEATAAPALDESLEETLANLDAKDVAAGADWTQQIGPQETAADPPTFIPAFPIERVKPADYNPRHLSQDAFERLQASLRRFGVVKPVILNANDTILAGHQRTKALTAIEQKEVPAIQLSVTINTTDEIRFNLLHNSIEENGAAVYGPKNQPEGYTWLKPDQFVVGDVGTAAVRVAACARLLAVYGTWGSVIVDPASGKVILNSDYAVACQQLRLPVLAYYPKAEDAAPLREALSGEYGIYDSTQVVDKPWMQNVVQPNRLRETYDGRVSYASRVWETLTLPRMAKHTRVLDFGAGKMDYVKKLSGEGWDVRAYEPFVTTMTGDGLGLDIATVIRQVVRLNREVRRDGLFDIVNLDSVLNATSSDEYHEAVLTVCSAMLKPKGILCLGTRSLARQEDAASAKAHRGTNIGLTFLDPNTNREINFMGGQFFTMQYHTGPSLAAALDQRFDEVHVEDTRNATILAVCAKPRPVTEERLRWALNLEFNMPYPDDFRHNKHLPLVEAVVEANRSLGRLLP